MVDSTDVASDDMRREARIRTGIDILEIAKQLKGDVPQVSEQVFVSRILPMFAQMLSPKASEEHYFDIGVWMEHANSMQTPLDVVGPNGEILFRAPSPLKSVIRLNKTIDQPGASLLAIVSRAKDKSNIHPALGENYLTSELMELDLIEDIDDAESVAGWKSIFERYNIIPKTETKDSNDVPTSTQSADLTFMDDDDPL